MLSLHEEARRESQYDDLSDLGTVRILELETLGVAAVERLTPSGSPYRRTLRESAENWKSAHHLIVQDVIGVLRALRSNYEAGYLQSIEETAHENVFGDFLEMARYLLDEGFKDAGAVIAGSSLEAHLRQLAEKADVAAEDQDGRRLKAERLNTDLRAAKVYGSADQKSVTAWLAVRNDAAHGDYDKYESGQVALVIEGVRDFMRRLPA